MRSIFFSLGLLAVLAGQAGCSDAPIGQPCTFSWPADETGAADCNAQPACHPLQASSWMTATVLNDACPVDCIQLPSLECTNLICVATQAEESSAEQPAYQVMNGRCAAEVEHTDCVTEAPQYGCMGYCSKECLSDASCPKGYKCSPMAPFGDNLRCDDERSWGDGDPTGSGTDDMSKACTSECTPTDAIPDGTSVTCPSSREGDASYDYAKCDLKDYQSCCTCMCNRYCPLLTKKFCRKIEWDQKMFPDAVTNAPNCSQD